MPMKRNVLTIYSKIYYTETKGVFIDGERIKYAKQGYKVVCSSCIFKHLSGEANTPTTFYLNCTINANPYEELSIKVGDKVEINNQTYYVTFVDDSDYRNVIIEARS